MNAQQKAHAREIGDQRAKIFTEKFGKDAPIMGAVYQAIEDVVRPLGPDKMKAIGEELVRTVSRLLESKKMEKSA